MTGVSSGLFKNVGNPLHLFAHVTDAVSALWRYLNSIGRDTILTRLKDEAPSKDSSQRARMHTQGWRSREAGSGTTEQGCMARDSRAWMQVLRDDIARTQSQGWQRMDAGSGTMEQGRGYKD